MKRAVLLSLLLLAGCSESNEALMPFTGCMKPGEAYYARRGLRSSCQEYGIVCPKPFTLIQKPDSTLACRLNPEEKVTQ